MAGVSQQRNFNQARSDFDAAVEYLINIKETHEQAKRTLEKKIQEMLDAYAELRKSDV